MAPGRWFACLAGAVLGGPAAFGRSEEVPKLSQSHAEPSDENVDRQDGSIAELIEHMQLCFLEEGAPDTPLNVSVPLVGTLQVWKLCCRNTSIGGLNISMNVHDEKLDWSGGATLGVVLGLLKTRCTAHWTLNNRAGEHAGDIGMSISTNQVDARPFVRVLVELVGDPMSVGGDLYPWPGTAANAVCAANFAVGDLDFQGSDAWLLRAIGHLGELLQGALLPVFCKVFEEMLPSSLNKALARVRDMALPFMENVPDDLGLPEAPPGSGTTYDLRTSTPLSWMHQLFQQGLQSGDLGRLIDQATGGSGSFMKHIGEGVKLVDLDILHPANLSIAMFLDGLGVEGMHTIDALDVVVKDAEQLAFALSQSHLNMSTDLRMLVTAPDPPPSEDALTLEAAIARLADHVLERFKVRLALSGVHLAGAAGLLMKKDQLDYLDQGSTWYNGQCMPTMVQNISVMRLDVQVTVDEFRWVSAVTSPEQLEAEFDRSINSLLGYLNSPMMRPTVTRLLQSVAAGQIRDAANAKLQDWLLAPQSQPCEADYGVGSPAGSSALAAVGGAACLAAFALFLRWTLCRSGGGGPAPSRCAALLAGAGQCFVIGGLLGYPFRAAIRTHNGGDNDWEHQDSIQYMYVLAIGDVLQHMPMAVVAVALSTGLAVARQFAAISAGAYGLTPRLANFVRWTSAIGAWGMSFVYIFAGTQITSFYARIVQLGSAFLDMGVQINPGLYLALLGLYLCDASTLIFYNCSMAAVQQKAALSVPRRPPRAALGALAGALLLVLAVPFVPLWTHHYGGMVGKIIHFQTNTYLRPISLVYILWNAEDQLLNPRAVGMGVYILQAFLFLHLILAPAVHAALALYIGLCLRLRRPPAGPDGVGDAARAAQLLPAGPAEGAKAPFERLSRVLVLARMWSGADAFAAIMLLVVPDLGAQLVMMCRAGCLPVQPVLEALDEGCNTVDSRFNYGIFLMLFSGLAVRYTAEVCAHRPLRALQRRCACAVEPSAATGQCEEASSVSSAVQNAAP